MAYSNFSQIIKLKLLILKELSTIMARWGGGVEIGGAVKYFGELREAVKVLMVDRGDGKSFLSYSTSNMCVNTTASPQWGGGTKMFHTVKGGLRKLSGHSRRGEHEHFYHH